MAAKVRRDKSGIYWVVVHHRGKRRHKRVGTDRRTAEKVAREIQARLVLGDFDIRADRREASVPFGSFAANWLRREVELPIERGLEGHLAHGTARVYRLQVNTHLSTFFGDLDVRTLDKHDVQRFYDHCLDTGRPKSAKSIDMAINVLRLILRHALAQGVVESNAVESWKAGRPRRRSSSVVRVTPDKVLSAAQLADVLRITGQNFPAEFPLVLFLADTGARLGEALALRWSDVDLEAGSAEISRSFSSGVRVGPTKTGRIRVVELSQRLVHVLARTQPNVFPIPDRALVFPNQSGGMLQATNFRSRVFKKVIREAIDPRASFSPHCLRHTWASLHLSRGTPIKWVQTQGGWTTAKVLLDTYSHFMPSEMYGFADALAAGNGTPAAPGTEDAGAGDDPRPEIDQFSWVYGAEPESTTPRSPIMHFTEPPPFLRNSETSATRGVTPRSRTWESRRSETPPGRTRKDSCS